MASKHRRYLTLGRPVAACGDDRMWYEVRPGRWDPPKEDEADVVVIVQERACGPLKSTSVFKMAIDPEAVESIIKGLQIWMEYGLSMRMDELFVEHRPQRGSTPLKACGSGPGRPSPHMFERSELGDGRLGEPLAGPADGFPEV